MNSAAYDLASYIRSTLGKGTALGTDVFCNRMPDSPANSIAVFQYGGTPSDRGMGNDTGALENSSLQVSVRNSSAESAESICRSIYESLDELGTNVTINSTVYTWLHPMQPPFLLERNQSNWVTFAFNLDCQRVRT